MFYFCSRDSGRDQCILYCDSGVEGYLDVGLYDTMKDLFVNFIGAVVFSVIGFFYARGRGKKSVVSLFVPRRKAEDRDYLSITNKKIK